jgi:hypothetical protein
MTAEGRKGGIIARQRLAKSMFRGNEHAWRNQSVAPRLTHGLAPDDTETNRGQLTVRHGDFYLGSEAVIKGSTFVNSRD